MKRMLLGIMILSFFFGGSVFADSRQICGNVYYLNHDQVSYLLKFDGLDPCAVGVAKLKYGNESKSLAFTVDDATGIIDVEQIGKMILDGDRLIMVESATVILDLYPFSPVPNWARH